MKIPTHLTSFTFTMLLTLTSLLLGCLNPVDSIVDANETALLTAVQDTIILHNEAPSRRTMMDFQTLRSGPSNLDVPVVRLENTASSSFTVSLALFWDARLGPDKMVPLGEIGLQPDSEPDRYTLDVREALRLTQNWGDPEQLHLSFELKPVTEPSSLDGILVHIGPVTWR